MTEGVLGACVGRHLSASGVARRLWAALAPSRFDSGADHWLRMRKMTNDVIGDVE